MGRNNQTDVYFRFSQDFFDDEILCIESLPNGDEIIVILLKIYVLAVRENGVYKLPMENGIINMAGLSYILRKPQKNVEIAIRTLIEYGVIEIVEEIDKVILKTPKLKNMIGKSSRQADSKRLKYNDNKLLDNSNDEPMVDTNKNAYGIFKNVWLTDADCQMLQEMYKNNTDLINRLSAYKRSHNKEYADDCAECISLAESQNFEKK